ncbi:MAG: hypothetical protein MR809_09285 [Rikenellaceae bacterium]|nr:hypothetical protein [Rikenellaceae bacterium]
MESILFELICRILQRNPSLLAIAISQQAKFEGWLKFELANELHRSNHSVRVEELVHGHLVDLCVDNGSLIELKTPNTSYKVGDNKPKTRPVTKNVQDIIDDIQKLRDNRDGFKNGYIAFVMFPIGNNDRYRVHINKIQRSLGNSPVTYQGLEVIAGFNTYVFVAKVF